MMQGIVSQNCEATLPIVLKNGTVIQLVDTVIDTGFSGFLTWPSDIISALGVKWEGRDIATLGDGTSCTFEIYLAIVIWDGQYREIYVNESETFPLIGMRLLRGYDLRIQTVEGGNVAIEALPMLMTVSR